MAAKSQVDPLDRLARAAPKEIIALMLWKDRHRNPEMSLQLTERDVNGLVACAAYLKVEAQVRIHRPQVRPAEPARAATATRSATEARPADQPRPFVVVQLVDQDGNSIAPVENNEEDQVIAEAAKRLRQSRDSIPGLVRDVLGQAAQGVYSDSLIQELAQAALALAKA